MAKIVISELQPLDSENLQDLSVAELESVVGGLSLGTFATILSAAGAILSLAALIF